MKVILIKDVPNLGEEGNICDVADGYGRNYLLPKKFALPHTKQNSVLIEQKREAIEQRKEEKRKEAQSLKERLEGEEIVLERPAGETGKLFGSVNNATIAEELEKRGTPVERKRIEIVGSNIKELGEYEVKIKLYDNDTATLKVTVNQAADQ